MRNTTYKWVGAVAVGAAAVAAAGCSVPDADTSYHGTVQEGVESPAATTPSVPAYPVTVTGSGESVKTVNLVTHGYIVDYQSSTHCLIAQPVEADGGDGISIVNECGAHSGSPLSGTTTFRATGRTTIHVSNTDGPWILTFTPL